MATRVFYLSFADGGRLPGDQFLGCCFVLADDTKPESPVIAAHALGCNPGGEVLIVPLEDDAIDLDLPIGRLLTEAELVELSEAIEPGGGELLEGSADELEAKAEKFSRERREER